MLENGSILKADGRQYQILEMLGRGEQTLSHIWQIAIAESLNISVS